MLALMNVTDAARRAANRMATVRQRRSAIPPVMRVSDHPGPPKVYYLCPHFDRPCGGVRAIYRHVDILNDARIPATVVHARNGFSCSWFEHKTRVTGASSVTLSRQDVLVVPEWYGPGLAALPSGPRIVIFNQNAYQTFDGLDQKAAPGAPYRGLPGLEAVLAVSHDNVEYLRFAFPEIPITLVRNAIDPAMFHLPTQRAGRKLAFMPRRRSSDARQVLCILGARGGLDDWDVVVIENRSEAETAELLRSCAIFLSFSAQEGFGLPPAEAMACGCYVIGFPGFAGREFLHPEFSSPIADGDVLAFARAVEAALAQEPAMLAARAQEGAEYVRRHYSPDRQRDDLLAFFVPLLASPRSANGAAAV
jgi:hypothetical protein